MKNRPIVTAQAHPNIAFIKYWGNSDNRLRLPSNPSLSMNLAALTTTTLISPNTTTKQDVLSINGQLQTGEGLNRFQIYLETIKDIYDLHDWLSVESTNSFPMAVGIASSASAYAALAIGLNTYFDLGLEEKEISTLARLGSGSACRSIPGGFCEWQKGRSHSSSFAFSIANNTHWDLYDCILVVNKDHKKVSSTLGHSLADTSPLQSVRVHDTLRRLAICREAILKKDFEKFSHIIELDSNIMHSVMLTSDPSIIYWQPTSIAIMHEIQTLRKNGIACAYTMDAGPNVHVICLENSLQKVQENFKGFPGLEAMYISKTGGPALIL